MSELDLRRKYNYWEGSEDPICNRGDMYEVDEEDLEDEDQSMEEMAVPEEEDES